MPPGSRKQVQSAHTGIKSRLWKVVYVDGVEQSREILHTDTYNPSKAIIKVGPAAPASVTPVQPQPQENQPAVEPATQPATQPAETQAPAQPEVFPGDDVVPQGPGM